MSEDAERDALHGYGQGPLSLPCLPVKPGWSRVHPKDYLRVAGEVWTGQKPIRQGLLVLEIPHGGIGDHLFYTPLVSPLLVPEHVASVQISINSKDNYGGRLFELIWQTHLCAFTRAPGWKHSGLRPREGNFCDGMVAQLTGRMPKPGSTKPILHRRTPRPEWWGATRYVVVDYNRKSNQDRLSGRWEAIWAHTCGIIRERFPGVAPLYYANEITPNGRLPEKDVGDYFSVIEHCEAFFGCYSGGAVLAAAYGKPAWIYCHHRDPSQSFEGHHYVEMG